MPAKISPQLRTRLKRVKLFLCDVDGVLTDGSPLPCLTPKHIRAD
jgi:hypothetical protein